MLAADRSEEEDWPLPIVRTGGRSGEAPKNDARKEGKKTELQEEKKSSSVNVGEEDRSEEDEEFYAANFRPFLRRAWQQQSLSRLALERPKRTAAPLQRLAIG